MPDSSISELTQPDLEIASYPSLDDSLIAEIVEVHRLSFPHIAATSPARLVAEDSEVVGLCSHPAMRAVAARRQGRLSGVVLWTDDLSAVPWVEPSFFERRTDERDGAARFGYIVSFFIDPAEPQSTLTGLIYSFVETLASEGMVHVYFDATAERACQWKLAARWHLGPGSSIDTVATHTFNLLKIGPRR